MTDLVDPPRLFDSTSTPPELREWLVRAKQLKPSSAEVQSLVHTVDGLAKAVCPNALSLVTPQPMAIQSAGLGAASGATKLFATCVVGLAAAAVGVGVGGWASQRHAGPSSSLNQEQTLIHGGDSSRQAPTSSEIGEAAPATLESRLAISPGASARAPESTPMPKLARSRHNSSRPVTQTLEWRILQSARQALTSDPERALALVREHAQRFPSGMLEQEREAIAIDALARQGRTSEAKERTQRFSSKFPTSPYRSHAEATVSRSANVKTKP